MIIYFVLLFDLWELEFSYDYCESSLEDSPYHEEFIILFKNKIWLTEEWEFYQAYIHRSTHDLALKKNIQGKKELKVSALSLTPQGHFTRQPFL